LLKLYEEIDAGRKILTRKVGRVLFMTFEHEGMHAETLLYMLLQRAGTGTIPPPGFAVPPWSSLAIGWNSAPEPKNDTVMLGPEIVTLGHDDPEADDNDPGKSMDVAAHEFGWDNEHPKSTTYVEQFRISWRPVTNGQFYDFYKGPGKGKVQLPASWVEDCHGIQVRYCLLADLSVCSPVG
jgi:formylglycine-generating enzyme required for sulfatase activity